MKILLDCDGVLKHFTKTFLEFCGSSATDEDITQFDICKALGLPGDSYARFGNAIAPQQLCAAIPSYPGARQFVAALQARHEVYACTTPFNVPWLSQRGAALEALGIPLKRQIQCADKAMVRADLLIDDKTESCIEFGAVNGAMLTRRRLAILFAQPWNALKTDFDRAHLAAYGVKRLDGYDAVLRELGCL
jgi:5'(3')-deoxyribonucleotidase